MTKSTGNIFFGGKREKYVSVSRVELEDNWNACFLLFYIVLFSSFVCFFTFPFFSPLFLSILCLRVSVFG